MSDLDVVGQTPDPVHALAYFSTPTAPFADRDLSDLLLSARRWNAEHGITGKLIVLEDEAGEVVQFAQWIEGEPSALKRCLERIQGDARHRIGDIREHGSISGRRFPGWDMGFQAHTPDAYEAETQALRGA